MNATRCNFSTLETTRCWRWQDLILQDRAGLQQLEAENSMRSLIGNAAFDVRLITNDERAGGGSLQPGWDPAGLGRASFCRTAATGPFNRPRIHLRNWQFANGSPRAPPNYQNQINQSKNHLSPDPTPILPRS